MSVCARLHGHSVVVCQCRTANGFLPCPNEAVGQLTATYPPAAYARHLTGSEQQVLKRALNRSTRLIEPGGAPPTRSVPHLAYSAGYTGSICDACGSLRMRRSGTCETCDDCGNAGGCG
jgi:hypothetical protein